MKLNILTATIILATSFTAAGQEEMTLSQIIHTARNQSVEALEARQLEKPCARDPRSPVPLTLAVQNSLTL